MNNLIKLLDKNLEYINHEIIGDTIYISVNSLKEYVCCPYRCAPSIKVTQDIKDHSKFAYSRTKSNNSITNRKMFCKNDHCNNNTFSEKFNFIDNKAKKTKKLKR